jgi:predicted transcriptional regulator
MKKPISVGIPENLAVSLDKLAKKTGRKKNLIVAASLNNFLMANENDQERTIRKYLEVERTLGENK